MSQDIWTQCALKHKFTRYKGFPWRIVESQYVIATRKLADSDEEQALLEEIIEEAKPPAPYDVECKAYHFLLSTPFRYPPLQYGSRVGVPERRGLWYGSEKIETAFAEKAYYLFLFRSGSSADLGTFEVPITAFRARIKTNLCADLTPPPFSDFEDDISSPTSYMASQLVGTRLRDLGAEVLRFKSARCLDQGVNIAVCRVTVFNDHQPQDESSWFCVSSNDTVEFKAAGLQLHSASRKRFKRMEFEVDGVFPGQRMGR